jgi:hypothetical protein
MNPKNQFDNVDPHLPAFEHNSCIVMQLFDLLQLLLSQHILAPLDANSY